MVPVLLYAGTYQTGPKGFSYPCRKPRPHNSGTPLFLSQCSTYVAYGLTRSHTPHKTAWAGSKPHPYHQN